MRSLRTDLWRPVLPGQLRTEYPEVIFQEMSRGDRRKDILHDEVGHHDCLKTLAEACHKAGFLFHALIAAACSRRETTMTVKAVNVRLNMGSWKSAPTRL